MGAALEGATPRMHDYGLLVLRLALAAVFVAHGAQKLFGIWGGGGLSAMAGIFHNLGLAPAFRVSYATSDEIRQRLIDMGLEVMDTAEGTKVRPQA